MKLSKWQLSRHKLALEMLEKSKLSRMERWDVLEMYQPSATTVGKGFFQTPHEDAQSVAQDGIDSGRVLDLGAGIGMLSYHVFYDIQDCGNSADITAIEQNPELVKIGMKIMPEVEWICGDMYDEDLIKNLGEFDLVVSNPPFGASVKQKWLPTYPSELLAIRVAMEVSDAGVFILPRGHYKLMWGERGIKKHNVLEHAKRFQDEFDYQWDISNFTTADTYTDTNIKTSIIKVTR